MAAGAICPPPRELLPCGARERDEEDSELRGGRVVVVVVGPRGMSVAQEPADEYVWGAAGAAPSRGGCDGASPVTMASAVRASAEPLTAVTSTT